MNEVVCSEVRHAGHDVGTHGKLLAGVDGAATIVVAREKILLEVTL